MAFMIVRESVEGGERGDDTQQMTTDWIRTRVGCRHLAICTSVHGVGAHLVGGRSTK